MSDRHPTEPDPELLRAFREAAKIEGRRQRLADDAKRSAADSRTLGDLERDGFPFVGLACGRCSHATSVAGGSISGGAPAFVGGGVEVGSRGPGSTNGRSFRGRGGFGVSAEP